MNVFAILLLVALMIATLAVLVLGLVNMAKTPRDGVEGEDGKPSERALKSNKLMWYRIYFQFGAVALIALMLFMASSGR